MSLFQKKQEREQRKTEGFSTNLAQPVQSAQAEQLTQQVLQTVKRPPVKRLLTYQVANLQEVGARTRQEDSFTFANAFDVTEIREKGLLFVVCDGMGGMKDGKVASETAIASIRRSFINMDRSADLAKQLKESVYLAADEVEQRLGGDGGSTIVAGILFQEKLYYASVGDSFLYLKRGDQLFRLNREHNLCCQTYLESIRSGEMDPKAGRECPEASALTQFLGMTGLDDVDGSVRPLPVRDGDVFLACSDGIGGVLSEEELLDALSLHSSQAMCQQMNQGIITHAKKNQDNYTALVVRCLY